MSLDLKDLKSDYGDPFAEAHACRTSTALFDFSFVSRARVTGPTALATVQSLTPRPLGDLPIGRVRYCLRLSPSGHVASDITIWRLAERTFEVMSGRHIDIADVLAAAPSDCAYDLSEESAIFSVQGPESLRVLRGLADVSKVASLPYFGCAFTKVAGFACLIGRLGYTGEAGFEIITAKAHATALWRTLAERAKPAGFAAADILRIEAAFILFANELRVPVTEYELGLGQFARTNSMQRRSPLILVSFTAETMHKPLLWQTPPELSFLGQPKKIIVTSACWSPLSRSTLGLGYVRRTDFERKSPIHDPTEIFEKIRVFDRPLHDPNKRRPRAPWQ